LIDVFYSIISDLVTPKNRSREQKRSTHNSGIMKAAVILPILSIYFRWVLSLAEFEDNVCIEEDLPELPDNLLLKSIIDHHETDFFRAHTMWKTKPFIQKMIPLPPNSHFPIVKDAESEPAYDASIHLSIENPSYLVTLKNFARTGVEDIPQVGVEGGVDKGSMAYTAPFQLLSKEGVRVVHDIVVGLKKYAVRNERNYELRGIYYLSPFIRALMNCPIFLGHLSKLAGEPVLPHFMLMNPAVNFGEVNDDLTEVVDHWHYDSIAYVAVALVSDIDGMVGGDLQLMREDKRVALEGLRKHGNNLHASPLAEKVETVDYGRSGACIFAQGSEVLHSVTKVQSAREDRISLVMSFQPANVFQPDKTILNTWANIFDAEFGTAPFEFFRSKAYVAANALSSYVERVRFGESKENMADMLRAVAKELELSASLLDNPSADKIYYYRGSTSNEGEDGVIPQNNASKPL
jgi:hypothetical protein